MKYCKLVLFLLIVCAHVQGQGTTTAADSFFSFTWFNFWILLSYVLVIALAVYTWLIIRPKMDRYRDEIESLKTRFSTYVKATSQPAVNDVKKQVEMLVSNHPRWGDSQEEINALVSRIETLEAARQSVVTPSPQENFVKKEKRNNIEIFYMTYPVGNYFPITAKSDTRDNTIYKFKVRPNKMEADFEVHTGGAPIQDLVNMVQTYIKPACDEENMPSTQVKTIVTSQAGLAVLEGDKWIIKKKALIRYE